MWSPIEFVQRVFAGDREPSLAERVGVNWGSPIPMADPDYDAAGIELQHGGRREDREEADGSDPVLASELNRVAVMRLREAKAADSERLLRRAAVILEFAGANEAELRCAVLTNLGTLHRLKGNWGQSRAALDRALKAAGGSSPELVFQRARALDQHGELHAAQGNLASAMHWYRQALAIKEEPARDRWEVTITLNKFAELYFRGRRYNEAEAYLVRAFSISGDLLGWGHPALAKPLQRLGHVYARQRKHANAEQALRFALRVLAGSCPDDHPAMIACLRMLAGNYRGLGRYAHAQAVSELADKLVNHSADRRHIAAFEATRFATAADYEIAVARASASS